MRIKYFLQALFNTRGWIRNYEYSKEWDIELRKEMRNRIVIKDHCVATVGKYKIWIANYPYASGRRWIGGVAAELPSRTTMMELRDLLEKNILVQVLDRSLPANFKLDP